MKTFIVYLSKNEFSVKMAKEAAKSIESFGIEYELFDGVVGNEGKKILTSFNVYPSIHVSQKEWTPGTIGCLASHYLLWNKLSKQDEPFLIIEQDGILVRDPREILHQIEDVCHLDAYLPFENKNNDPNYNHLDYYNSKIKLYKSGVKNHPKSTFYPNNKISGSSFRGTYGYIMTPKGAKNILEFTKNHGLFPSDRCICEKAMNLQRANSTYVRLNPFFKTWDIQKEYSFRKKNYKFN